MPKRQSVAEIDPTEISQQLGDVYNDAGWPRIAGRVLGLLLVADPPYLSTSQLCEQLPASKAHVSGATQLLTSLNFIQRFGVAGSKEAHYRLSPHAWTASVRAGFAGLVRMVEIAESARSLVTAGSQAAEQVEEMVSFYSFIARRMPELIDEYEARR